MTTGTAWDVYDGVVYRVLKKRLGPRNDWDLLALSALPLTLLAAYLLLHLPDSRPRRMALAAYLSYQPPAGLLRIP